MQLTNIKISNLLSYPYQPNLNGFEGVKFHNKDKNDVNVLIWPNGAGKSWFLHILRQVLKVAVLNDYMYDRQNVFIDKKKVITINDQYTDWLYAHFRYPEKPSQTIVEFALTQHDYDNMQYISRNADILNALVATYSTLNITYPKFSDEEIDAIPNSFVLECSFDVHKKTVDIAHTHSPQERFVLLYLQTIELIQIFIDIYNDLERWDNAPLVPLANGIWFVGIDRSLEHVSNVVDPRAWNTFIGTKDSVDYHSYIWFYLCVKKIRNIISDHSTLKMSQNDMIVYSKKLEQSDFYISMSAVIKKYLNKTLHIEYADKLLTFLLIDQFGQKLTFAELSDWEQSLLSMIFTMYGYDLREGLIIIDEPEIHFHPQMQRSFWRIIENMNKNIRTQFILSTYSPLFINESNIGNVYRVAKINGETMIKNPSFTLSSDESTLVHLLKFENLSKIFFVNNIIMVEGETDAYFFDFYLKHLHMSPEWKDKLTDYEIININGKWSYKVRSTFLSRFGLRSFFIGDWDNIVDYGFMTQNDLTYYYKQARAHYAWLKKTGKTHRHYNKLVDTIRNVFPKEYKRLLVGIDGLYKKHIFILKKWDIETYLDMPEKWLENMVKFCHYDFKRWLENSNFDSSRQEFADVFSTIFL